jgi:hypothetical protein
MIHYYHRYGTECVVRPTGGKESAVEAKLPAVGMLKSDNVQEGTQRIKS